MHACVTELIQTATMEIMNRSMEVVGGKVAVPVPQNGAPAATHWEERSESGKLRPPSNSQRKRDE